MRDHVETSAAHYLDVLFDLPDGRQICVTVSKDGTYRLMERVPEQSSWGPPIFGTVVK